MFHTLTKKMLSSAEVVAQVELKFIIIKTCGIICAVDQHAADERVALEKLVSALSNPDMHDDTVICMTKRSITKRDLLKIIKVNPSKKLSLSQKDMATVKHHWSLLKKCMHASDCMTDSEPVKTAALFSTAESCDNQH